LGLKKILLPKKVHPSGESLGFFVPRFVWWSPLMVGCPPCQVMVPWKDGKIPGKISPGFREKNALKHKQEGLKGEERDEK